MKTAEAMNAPLVGKIELPADQSPRSRQKSPGRGVTEFAGKIAKAMKELSSSHVYFIIQQAYGPIDWSEAEEILQKIIDATSTKVTK
jgi:hypothetical protein